MEKHPDSRPSSERLPSRGQAEKQIRILVVDDEPVVLTSTARVLTRAGYLAVTAGSGEEAIQKYKAGKFDAVVSDFSMPGMNGLELLQALKMLDPSVRMITISGGLAKENMEALRAEGAFCILGKPFESMVLLAVVRTAVESPFPAQEPLTDNIIGSANALARIMYVDDDDDLRDTMADAGEFLGFSIQTASCGGDALVEFIKSRPEVIVSDLHMPQMNGLELLKAIRAIDANARVIIVSGEANRDEKCSLIEAGALMVLQKPVDLDTLARAVNEALSR